MSGFVFVDKPTGMTSHDVVNRLRRIFDTRSVGHAGTLDPSATGVLIAGVGRATRLLKFFSELDKTYSCEVVFGTTTTTGDADGEVLEHFDMSDLDVEKLNQAALSFVGEIKQIPPMYSAIKVNGQPLYKAARAGQVIERTPRAVCIYELTLNGPIASVDETVVFEMTLSCSSGTYVRSLAADLGAHLGGGAHLRNLRRRGIGPFKDSNSIALDELSPNDLVSPLSALSQVLPTKVVDEKIAELVSHGRPLSFEQLGEFDQDEQVAIADKNNNLLAVYQCIQSEQAKPLVVSA